MKTTTKQLTDLLGFLVKDAERHGLSSVTLSVARCKTLIADFASESPKPVKTPSYFKRLDTIHAI